MAQDIKKVVLAYSGGLDTSIILKWLRETYDCEVVTFTADLGQGEELEPARKKAEMLGIKEIYIDDLREEFVRDFVFPMFRANTVYEGLYLLGTSIARPLIAKRLVEIAHETGADAIAHGATGKGNDQVRFELTANALDPAIRVIAPWREWDLQSRTKLLEYAEANQIPIAKDKRGEAPFSVDANLLHTSSEGRVLEDPATEAPDYVYQRTTAPEQAPDAPEIIRIGFEKGDAVSINGEKLSPASLLTRLNELGGRHGVGRLDLVENRFVGMKSRGVYETPGGTVLYEALEDLCRLTLTHDVLRTRAELAPRMADLVYQGLWFAPVRAALQAFADTALAPATGTVTLELFQGSARAVARTSPNALYQGALASFDMTGYEPRHAEGFIRLFALPLSVALRAGGVAPEVPEPAGVDRG
jgi:argininosuccinate synthase